MFHFISIVITLLVIYIAVKLPCWLSSKTSTCNAGDAGDAGRTPGSGRCPGGGHGTPLQYSCLETPMDRGAWRAAVQGVSEVLPCIFQWTHLWPLPTRCQWALTPRGDNQIHFQILSNVSRGRVSKWNKKELNSYWASTSVHQRWSRDGQDILLGYLYKVLKTEV